MLLLLGLASHAQEEIPAHPKFMGPTKSHLIKWADARTVPGQTVAFWRVYYGRDPAELVFVLTKADVDRQHLFQGLADGLWFVRLSYVTDFGHESALSNTQWFLIGDATDDSIVIQTVQVVHHPFVWGGGLDGTKPDMGVALETSLNGVDWVIVARPDDYRDYEPTRLFRYREMLADELADHIYDNGYVPERGDTAPTNP
jgi:hypothetical protein